MQFKKNGGRLITKLIYKQAVRTNRGRNSATTCIPLQMMAGKRGGQELHTSGKESSGEQLITTHKPLHALPIQISTQLRGCRGGGRERGWDGWGCKHVQYRSSWCFLMLWKIKFM